MQYLIAITTALLFVFQGNSIKSQSIYIKGKFVSETFNKCYLVENPSNPVYSKTIDSCMVNEKNEFYFKSKINKPGYYEIYADGGYPVTKCDLIIYPMDSLNLIVVLAGDSTRISGKGSLVNNYILQFQNRYTKKIAERDILNDINEMSFDAYITKWEKEEFDLLQKFAIKNAIDSFAINNIKYSIRNFSYYNRYWYYINKKYENGNFPLFDTSFYNFEKNINYNQGINSPMYFLSLNAYCKAKLLRDKTLQKTPFSELKISSWFKVITENLEGISRDYALLQLKDDFQHFHRNGFFNNVDSISNYFSKNYTDKAIYDKFQSEVTKIRAFKPGQVMKDISLPDSTGNLISISQFKDKIIYIYVWATWCMPCIEKLPDFNKYVEKYAENKDIQFINICLAPNGKETWKFFVKKNGLKGISLYSESNSFFEDYYLYAGAPKYFILNKNNSINTLFGTCFIADMEIINNLLLKE